MTAFSFASTVKQWRIRAHLPTKISKHWSENMKNKYDREAQNWALGDWEDRLACEARNDTVVICCALMLVVCSVFLFNGIADWMVGL